jgi:hypothetical protein
MKLTVFIDDLIKFKINDLSGFHLMLHQKAIEALGFKIASIPKRSKLQ